MATSKKPMPLLVRAKETTPPSTRTGGRVISDISQLRVLSDADVFMVDKAADGMCYKVPWSLLKATKTYGLLSTNDGDTSSPLATQAVTTTAALLATWNNNGPSSNTTVDHTADSITVDTDGIYEIDMSISFSGTLSQTFTFEIYHNDISASPQVTATGYKMVRKLGTGGDVGSASLTGLVSMSAGDAIMIYVSSGGSNSITVHQAQLMVSDL